MTAFAKFAIAVLAALVAPLAALAGPANPTAVDVLFETKHLANCGQGQDLAYRFQRAVSRPELLGQPFSDDIHLAVKAVNADGSRNLIMSVFTGERARDPLPVPDMNGNPLLVLFLDRAVNNYHSLAGGAQPYIKQQIRAALRDKAKVEPVKLDYQGKTVDALRVSVVPFIGDPNAAKMSGYEGSEFTFVVSNDVPGQFATMVSKYESGLKDSPRLEESITLAGVGEVK